jgi:hypothetical protein
MDRIRKRYTNFEQIEAIERALEALDCSVIDLAKVCQISRPHLSNVKTGRLSLSTESYDQFKRAVAAELKRRSLAAEVAA